MPPTVVQVLFVVEKTSRQQRASNRRTRTVALGGGVNVPYPEPTSAAASTIGKANKRRDTKLEVLLRSTLHRRGLRFRKDHLIRCVDIEVKPDVVFPRARVAVFVDGCFWHCCPEHGTTPRRNQSYWLPKLQRNVERDRSADVALQDAGWVVERIWEHEDVDVGADRVLRRVRDRMAAAGQAKRS